MQLFTRGMLVILAQTELLPTCALGFACIVAPGFSSTLITAYVLIGGPGALFFTCAQTRQQASQPAGASGVLWQRVGG